MIKSLFDDSGQVRSCWARMVSTATTTSSTTLRSTRVEILLKRTYLRFLLTQHVLFENLRSWLARRLSLNRPSCFAQIFESNDFNVSNYGDFMEFDMDHRTSSMMSDGLLASSMTSLDAQPLPAVCVTGNFYSQHLDHVIFISFLCFLERFVVKFFLLMNRYI